jgi:hypothetical protein
MPLKVTDLKPGDRVLLNCPKSRLMTKREAVFEGLYHSLQDAMADGPPGVLMIGKATEEFLRSGAQGWAGFLFQVTREPVLHIRHPDGTFDEFPNLTGEMSLRGAFVVEPDGSLREEEGRRIFIERRVVMGRG